MKLKEFALLAEVISALAIVISLIFVIIELRNSTEAVQAQSRQSIAARIEERSLIAAANLSLLEAMNKNRNGIELNPIETLQLELWHTSILTSLEEAYLQNQDGNLSDEFLKYRLNRTYRAFTTTAGREFLRVVSEDQRYSAGFIDWLNGRIQSR